MATMNVSLPDELKKFVEVAEHGYAASSEFLRELIRNERDRTRLHTLIIEGMNSGPGSEMEDAYFVRFRKHIRGSDAA